MQPREQPADDHRHYLEFFLDTSITGNIHVGNANELHGPFEDKEISPYSMEHASGLQAKVQSVHQTIANVWYLPCRESADCR